MCLVPNVTHSMQNRQGFPLVLVFLCSLPNVTLMILVHVVSGTSFFPQRDRLGELRGLVRPGSRQHQASIDIFRLRCWSWSDRAVSWLGSGYKNVTPQRQSVRAGSRPARMMSIPCRNSQEWTIPARAVDILFKSFTCATAVARWTGDWGMLQTWVLQQVT